MSGRFIVDLNGYGREFYNCIRNFSLGYRADDAAGQLERERHIYMESAQQIFMHMDADVYGFMAAMQNLPNMKQFEHIPDLFLPERYKVFADNFRIFAMGLLSQMQAKLPMAPHMDYLLETLTDNYMIVLVKPKATGEVYDLLF